MDKELVVYNPSDVLNSPTPQQAIYTRPGPGGMQLSYVPWAWVAKQMNKAFGAKWSVRYLADPKMQNSEVLVMIEVATPDGVQQAYGSHRYLANNPNASYSDAVQSATSKALRRACARWGAGLDLYLGAGEDIDSAAMEVRDSVLGSVSNPEAVKIAVAIAIEAGKSPFEAWANAAVEFAEEVK